MKLPVIKQAVNFALENNVDYIHETLEVLENLSEARGLKDEELDVIGEVLSNLYGAIEVLNSINEGMTQKEALNSFMKRVQGAIS